MGRGDGRGCVLCVLLYHGGSGLVTSHGKRGRARVCFVCATLSWWKWFSYLLWEEGTGEGVFCVCYFIMVEVV